MRVTCSITISASPSTTPCTSNRTAPCVPASKAPIEAVVTVVSSSRRCTLSRISSSSTPRALAMSRIWPPQTMDGTVGAIIGGS